MGIRDVVLLLIMTAGVPVALFHPYVGILLWTWLSIMNPHRLTWAVSNLPFAATVAIATMLGLLLSRDRRQLVVTPVTIALGAFMIWICITFPFSIYPGQSYEMWTRVLKIDIMLFVALLVLHTRRHIHLLLLVVVGSIAFYGVKGGLFTLLTGGSYRVWGPAGSFIEGNNEIALAIVMTIPLINYIRMQSQGRWVKLALAAGMVLSAFAALGSQSRGALLAIAAMAFFLWLRSRQKLLSGVGIFAVAIGILMFMPDTWYDRMETIPSYQQDSSAMGRINAWWMAWNLALDHFFGGGFEIYTPEVFSKYAPVPTDVHAAHSIYFQVLGEHGLIGLTLFLVFWILVWFAARRLYKQGRASEATAWASDLGAMCQVSLIGYAVGGAFLSLAYFDLPYNIAVIVVLAARWVQEYQNGMLSQEEVLAGSGGFLKPR